MAGSHCGFGLFGHRIPGFPFLYLVGVEETRSGGAELVVVPAFGGVAVDEGVVVGVGEEPSLLWIVDPAVYEGCAGYVDGCLQLFFRLGELIGYVNHFLTGVVELLLEAGVFRVEVGDGLFLRIYGVGQRGVSGIEIRMYFY